MIYRQWDHTTLPLYQNKQKKTLPVSVACFVGHMCIQFQGGRKAADKGHQYGPPMMIICHKLIWEDYNKLDLHQFSTRAKKILLDL